MNYFKIKDFLYITVIILLLALCGQFYYSYHYLPRQEIKVYYNQDIEANKKIIEVIRDADKFVYFAIYTFTRLDIKDALLAAKHRGLEVRGIMDRRQIAAIKEQKEIFEELQEAGISVITQDHSGLMHIKTVVTEKAYVSGSYNWTASATTINDEVLEVGRSELVRKQYEDIIKEVLSTYSGN
jgi:phosphatidylserine/phosphatidylglycerophosphate/cardiolipin synthase-like enzyme